MSQDSIEETPEQIEVYVDPRTYFATMDSPQLSVRADGQVSEKSEPAPEFPPGAKLILGKPLSTPETLMGSLSAFIRDNADLEKAHVGLTVVTTARNKPIGRCLRIYLYPKSGQEFASAKVEILGQRLAEVKDHAVAEMPVKFMVVDKDKEVSGIEAATFTVTANGYV